MARAGTAADSATQAQTVEVMSMTYRPSWVDHVTDWVRQLPGPSWAYYVAVWLVLTTLETVIKWVDGAYPVGTLFPYHLVSGLWVVYSLAMIHYLDDRAGPALDQFRPALQASDVEFAALRYQFTTLPARSTLLVTALGFAVSNAVIFLFSDPVSNALIKINTSPLATMLDYSLAVIGWPLWAVLIYHGIRQLRLVNHLYTTAPNLDLFRPSPLYAFAGLSARTSVSMVALPYVAIAAAPGVLTNPATPLIMVPLTALAALIFLAPLLGVHRLLESQKRRLQDDVGQRLSAASVDLQRKIDAKDLSQMTELKNGIDGLVAVQNEVSKLRTWPWRPGTAGGLGAALLLPLIIWALQRLFERLGF